jgi:hypothetical protein
VIEDPEKTAARLAFLHSSVPQTLRDQMASNKVLEDAQMADAPVPFPKVSHVQQKCSTDPFWNLEEKCLKLRNVDVEDPVVVGQNFRLNLNFPVGNEFSEESFLPKVERLSNEQVVFDSIRIVCFIIIKFIERG